MSAATTRRVRVTLQAEARTMPDTSVTRLVLDEGPSIIVDESWASILEVEPVPEVRQWQDGDVVQSVTYGWTRTRERQGDTSVWVSSRHVTRWADEDVDDALAAGPDKYRVLRYQAGETA